MPFSKKITFVEEVIPSTLPDDSNLFYCEPTQEAFMHYDDFCTRVIQCNSLIWTDTVSGKSDLTYLEALESEKESATVLALLPDTLHVPVLYIASIAQCSSLENKLNDVYHFIEDRFFLGETVQFFTTHDNAWKNGIISQVIAPNEEEIEEIRSSVQLLDGGEFFPPPAHYLYEIECSDGSGNKHTMGIPLLKRPTGTWTKEIAENFLQHFIIQDEDKWLIDRGVMDRFNIPTVNFHDFYDGNAPVFPIAQIREVLKPTSMTKKSIEVVRKSANQKYIGSIRNKKSERLITKQDRKHMKQLDKGCAINGLAKEKLQQTDIKNYFRSSYLQEGNQRDSESTEESFGEDLNRSHNKSTDNDTEDNSLVSEEADALDIAVPGTSSRSLSTVSKRKKVRGAYLKKGKQLRITGDGRLEGVERKSKYGTHSARKESPINKEREKLRKQKKEQAVLEGFQLHEERLRMKAKQEEEKLQFAKFMKEWRKKREDLECEDLKPLPVPHRINSNIPNHLFGDFVMILEFLNSFHDFLKVKSYIPGGVSLEILERALVEKEIAGPLYDILCMFLNSIFECQTAENENQQSVDTLDELYGRTTSNDTDIDSLDPTGLCDTFRWCETFLGVSIQDVDLTPISVSEILRLHLLGSGGRHSSVAEWLTNCDDPTFWFRREHSPILFHLRKQHVCELPVAEKLTILSCLMNEILGYTQVRDMVDDRGEQMRMAKVELRALEIAELKLQKEATAKRIQNKRTAKLLRLKGELSGKSNAQLIKHQKDAEIEKLKIEKEISKLKTDIQRKQNKILPLIMKHQLHPIGSDRAHRNFWLFSSLPGLFVECNPFELGPCLPGPTPLRTEDRGDIETHVRKLFQQGQNNNSDKENDISDGELSKPPCSPNKKMLAEQNVSVDPTNCNQNDKEMLPKELEEKDAPQYEYLICTADNKCPVHCLPISMSCWSFFSNPHDVVLLLDSLNERGVRESDLRRAMIREQERIKESISSCPLQKLSASKFLDQELRKSTRNSVCYKPEIANMNFPHGTPVKKIMETVLRNTILEMESKITLGCLGVLKVEDRAAWRSALEKGDYDPQCERLVWGFPKGSPHQKGSGKNIVSSVLKACVENEMDRSMSKDASCSETPNEQCAINVVHGWNMSNTSDLNMIEIEGDKQEAGEEGHSSNRCIKNMESPDHLYSNSNIDSHVELCMDNVPSGELDESACEEIQEADSQNLFGNDSPSENEANLSSVKEEEEMEDEKVPIDVNEKVNSLGRDTILMEMPHKTQIINNLAAAILQLGQSVDPKFLIKPLANNDSEECALQMRYWETSVMTAINFSQLFLYQFILDKSINWSKSILRIPCRICRRRGEPETMVSCSKCHKRYHHKCTNTKDSEIPKDCWLCPFCTKEHEPKRSRAKKRKNDNTEPECNEVLLNNSPERKSARLVCHKCGISGEQLINCSSCSEVYHSNCLNPYLRGNLHLEENWLCDACKATKDSDSPDAEFKYYAAHEDSDETLGRGRRVCASATMAKIASFAKRLRSRSWDDEDEATSDCSTSSRFSSEYVRSAHRRGDSPVRRSSRRADFISESLPLDNAVLQNLLDEMIHHEDSWPFLRPVRKSEVPDYHQYIKKPMDLGTIKYKLNTAEYRNNYDFVVDALLVFENCFMYNSSETAVYKCGVEMSQFFKKRCQELGLMECGYSDESEILMA